jgi:sugar lactone lactonase YvrE
MAVGLVASAAQPQFWKIEGARDFLDGDTEGLTVDSEGRVRLSPASTLLHDPEVPYVWALARDAKGTLYAGTGNDGKVFRIAGGQGALLYDAGELEVHALAVGPDGRLYAASSPDGKVYAIDASGKAEPFYDPTDRYVWALAFDAEGRLLVATGAEARIHRVDRAGKGEVLLTTPETHLTALAADAKGQVYAGSAPGGIVYRLDAAGRAFVLLDSSYREVKALGPAADGGLYVAAIDGSAREETRPSQPALPALPPDIGVLDTVTVTAAPQPSPTPSPRAPEPARAGTNKGAVLRILASGEVDVLWTSQEDTPHSLVVSGDGVLVGTGNRGKLYRIHNDRTWAMVGALPAEQVTGLQGGPGGALAIATSNPGKVHELGGSPGGSGTFTSKVRDTDTVTTWGRIRWEATLPAGTTLRVQTRSGNSGNPDSTWSEWSSPYARASGDPVTSPRARFLQVRALLTGTDGASPTLDGITTAYLQRNLRPAVSTVTVHPAGEIFQRPLSVTGEIEILGFEPGDAPELRPGSPPSPRPVLPTTTSFARRLYQKGVQTFSWRGEDPNGDQLAYDVHYRAVGDARYRLLRRGMTEAVLAWDTTTVPNGRYVVRVTASDSPSNPPDLALSGDKESLPFEVDNTPPTVVAALLPGSGLRIRVTVRDDSSLVRKAEYSIDGGRWREVHPVDGINDALEESYEFTPGDVSGPGPHLLVVRASDLLGNVATARVEIP